MTIIVPPIIRANNKCNEQPRVNEREPRTYEQTVYCSFDLGHQDKHSFE